MAFIPSEVLLIILFPLRSSIFDLLNWRLVCKKFKRVVERLEAEYLAERRFPCAKLPVLLAIFPYLRALQFFPSVDGTEVGTNVDFFTSLRLLTSIHSLNIKSEMSPLLSYQPSMLRFNRLQELEISSSNVNELSFLFVDTLTSLVVPNSSCVSLVRSLTRLRHLDLGTVDFVGAGEIGCLLHLPHLEKLHLQMSSMTDRIAFESLSRLKLLSLKELKLAILDDISQPHFLCEAVKHLSALRSLTLHNETSLSDDKFLSHLPQLHTLQIHTLTLDMLRLLALASLAVLKVENLRISRGEESEFARLMCKQKNLIELAIPSSPFLTAPILNEIVRSTPRLESLNISNSECLEMISDVTTLKNLTLLDISSCPQISDEILSVILDRCSRLASLSITGCPKIAKFSSRSLNLLSILCDLSILLNGIPIALPPKLTHLSVRYAVGDTRVESCSIFKELFTLRSLSLSYCDPDLLRIISSSLSRLEVLRIDALKPSEKLFLAGDFSLASITDPLFRMRFLRKFSFGFPSVMQYRYWMNRFHGSSSYPHEKSLQRMLENRGIIVQVLPFY